MKHVGVILYGAPATGKNTITAELAKIDARFEQFQRVKVGSGSSEGYRMATPEDVTELRRQGDIIYENSRYGNLYVIDRVGLKQSFNRGKFPVVHLGQISGVQKTAASGGTWISVALTCDRAVAMTRMHLRGDTDTSQRLAAWQETMQDIETNGLAWASTVIETQRVSPTAAANLIASLVRSAVNDAS